MKPRLTAAHPSRATLLGLLGLAAALALTSCNRPSSGSAGPQAWIDAPLHESIHAVAPMEIVLHGSDPGGVSLIELSINGEVLSRKPPDDTASALVTHRVQWDPPGPGEYLLVARAQNHAGAWSGQASNRVTLIDLLPLEIITATPTPAQITIPTWTPTPACVDRAGFVADVTVPDNSPFAPGAAFTKTWRLRNDGNCPWNEDYKVVFASGDPMGNPTPVPIPGVVPAGATVDISLPMTAPSSPGTYRGNYQIRNPQGLHFGVGAGGQTPFYVQIVVGATATPVLSTPTHTPGPDTQPPSVSVSHSPPGSSLPVGSTITFTANASDNVGVVRIDLWVTAPGGWPTKVRTCTNTSSCSYTGGPYNTTGNLSYFAVAADAAGHETNSGAGSITIYVVISGRPGGGGV
jgi:hypothetical protein